MHHDTTARQIQTGIRHLCCQLLPNNVLYIWQKFVQLSLQIGGIAVGSKQPIGVLTVPRSVAGSI